MDLNLKGMDKLIKGLSDRMEIKPVQAVVRFHTAAMHRHAMLNAPVDTGFLRRQIKMAIQDNGLTGIVKSGAEYAPYLEYGTRYMAPKPHIRPAFYNVAWDFRDDLARLMK